ncbi:TcpE family conjugal transfer membrane protein [Actinomadura sp. 21ATH]|uniref:TcpE family conjugal transfer membrane protein n=1 Tax=Actinomadura sp. 21ATH TaxID=1735444 RepID=UPI0035C0D1D2
MDLPTYTNIWRIEKRLYKLYDLRLPMPLPLVQIGVFAGVFVPWILLLKIVGIPFESPWHVLYIVPPGVLTWLATRPVIEGKRLTELLLSQTRYLAEPRTWCRLTPIREPREVVIVARVWRRPQAPAPAAAPERAALKTRRKARKRGRAEEIPAFTPTAALPPTPAIASEPRPLAEHAAQRDWGTLGTEDDVHVAGTPTTPAPATVAPAAGPPAASAPAAPAAKPWRRSTRDIAHEEEARPDLERPPATPQLEFGASGKRAFASGIRRAGSPPEFWKTPTPADASATPPRASDAQHAAEPTPPTEQPPASAANTATDLPASPPGAPATRPQTPDAQHAAESTSGAEQARAAAADTVTDLPASPPGGAPGDGSSGDAPAMRPHGAGDEVAAESTSATGQAPASAADTVTDLPASPQGGAPGDDPHAAGGSGAGSEGEGVPAALEQLEREDAPAAAGEPAADGDAFGTRPESVARSEAERTGTVERDESIEAARASDGQAAPADTAEESAGDVRPAATRPDIPQRAPETRPDIPQVAQAKPTRPDIPMVPGAFGAAERNDAEAPRREPPKPWSEELSNPLRAATTDALVWPPVPAPRGERPAGAPNEAQPPAEAERPAGDLPAEELPVEEPPAYAERPGRAESPSEVAPSAQDEWAGRARWPVQEESQDQVERAVGGHASRAPMSGAAAGYVQEEPPREVRSGPASPVRPRPLPPPPPAPPSEPAITPPDPEQETHGGGGLRRLIHAVGGGHGEADAEYQQRLQQPFQGTRHIVVLGCTGGAGQTVTALMLGHTFAQHNGEPVVAIDVNPGPGALARRTRSETNETLTGLITRADQVNSLTAMRRYTSQAKSGLEVVAAGKNPLQALDDRDYALAMRTIDRFYSVTLLDAAAAVVARVLPYADQVVLVAPASADAPRAVAMTYEWLDGHGYEELRSRAVTVINGVSRRSMDDVEQAESVARGRCRALVRIPWDDHLSMDRAPRNELRSLRAPTRRAYLALAGVVAGGFAEVPERYQERQQEQEATR